MSRTTTSLVCCSRCPGGAASTPTVTLRVRSALFTCRCNSKPHKLSPLSCARACACVRVCVRACRPRQTELLPHSRPEHLRERRGNKRRDLLEFCLVRLPLFFIADWGRMACAHSRMGNSTTSHLEKKDPSELVAASKLREPYRRKWKPVRGLTHARPDMTTSIEIRQMLGQLYCAFQPIYTFYRECEQPPFPVCSCVQSHAVLRGVCHRRGESSGVGETQREPQDESGHSQRARGEARCRNPGRSIMHPCTLSPCSVHHIFPDGI